MTPKEKAIELVNRYRNYVDDGRHNGFYSSQVTYDNQKHCALIAVDELILNSHNQKTDDYWQQVKTEIENL